MLNLCWARTALIGVPIALTLAVPALADRVKTTTSANSPAAQIIIREAAPQVRTLPASMTLVAYYDKCFDDKQEDKAEKQRTKDAMAVCQQQESNYVGTHCGSDTKSKAYKDCEKQADTQEKQCEQNVKQSDKSEDIAEKMSKDCK